MFKRVAGTKDILPKEVSSWQQLEQISRNIFSVYNYREIRPPLIEEAALFNRSLGESTEIVQKQMFMIRNKQELYALRPEATASIVRAYIENSLDKIRSFLKVYYIGPMFRLERPQKGRLRQFHHLGVEAVGSDDAYLDVEVISLANRLLNAFGVNNFRIKINSLGCSKDKDSLIEVLKKNLKHNLEKFCDDCRQRFKKNVLRILDCKKESCNNMIKKLDIGNSYLCSDCGDHFNRVKEGLDILGINYELMPYLVRGLDYYTRTVFEIVHKDLGAQDALGAGGRYDNLLKLLGGPNLGAIGFAFGIERLLLVAGNQPQTAGQNLVYLITLGAKAKKEGVGLLEKLRQADIASDGDYEGKSIKAAMRAANDLGARYAIIIGDDELKKNVVSLKDMQAGTQEEIGLDNIISRINNKRPVSSI